MSRDSWIFLSLAAYVLLFAFAVGGTFIWRVKRHGSRAPVAFKLLRGPGETLRRRMAKFDDDLLLELFLGAIAPLLAGLGIAIALGKVLPAVAPWPLVALTVGVVLFLVGTAWAARRTFSRFRRYRDDKLGYLGEREVAEHLPPLLARGYRVFHDVPAEGANGEFNLDHVTVGPAGVAVIEVKTRRKGKARPGYAEHVVTFDGQQLHWPWGEKTRSIEQAVRQAEWLQQFIRGRTGIDTPVRAVLALPGWYVEAKARGAVAVVNSKSVSLAVEGRGPRLLTAEQIDLIARQLDPLCRDVED